MKISPIQHTYHSVNPPQRRAQIAINYDKHTVIDSVTRERFDLDPVKAWEKFNEINGIIV